MVSWPKKTKVRKKRKRVVKFFKNIKKTHDGRAMLNIGCGLQTHLEWNNLDFSPYARLAQRKSLTSFLHAVGILSDFRYQNILQIDPDIIYWDLRRGVPFGDNTLDVIYHSHFIPHVDRAAAAMLTRECRRALKPDGILRMVVPDLQNIVRLYNEAVTELEKELPCAMSKHAQAVDELFELMVRRDARGTSRQNPIVRIIERIVRGGIEKTGELRRWHYDQYSMGQMLCEAGFRDVQVAGPDKSDIEGWNAFWLDREESGSVYKPGSLYMEGTK